MKRIDKPWGYEILWAETDFYVGKKIFISGGHRLSLQFHEEKEETICVIKGVLILQLDGNDKDQATEIKLQEGDAYHIPPGTVHRMIAENDVLLVEVSTAELDDVVRLDDDYGRADAPDSMPTIPTQEAPFWTDISDFIHQPNNSNKK